MAGAGAVHRLPRDAADARLPRPLPAPDPFAELERLTGWFGGITRSGATTGFNPATGAAAAYDGDTQAQAACAAVAYAISRGNLRAVQDFSRVDISGLIV